jgi:hypothetical protein
MLFNSPISSDKANMLIDLLPLSSSDRVIDVGCGTYRPHRESIHFPNLNS